MKFRFILGVILACVFGLPADVVSQGRMGVVKSKQNDVEVVYKRLDGSEYVSYDGTSRWIQKTLAPDARPWAAAPTRKAKVQVVYNRIDGSSYASYDGAKNWMLTKDSRTPQLGAVNANASAATANTNQLNVRTAELKQPTEGSSLSIKVKLAPQPVNDRLAVIYKMNTYGYLAISIQTAAGVTLDVQHKEVDYFGEQRTFFDTTTLQPGAYFVNVRSHAETVTVPFVVMR